MELYKLKFTITGNHMTIYALADSKKDVLNYAAETDSKDWKIDYLATLNSSIISERLIDLRGKTPKNFGPRSQTGMIGNGGYVEQPKNPSKR